MMELGSYWAFYSTWFLTHVKNGQAILVEPLPENIVVSLATLSLNHCIASVELGTVGERPTEFESIYLGGSQTPNYVVPLMNVDELMEAHSVEHLYILHSDIQGAELKMLDGAARALENQRIDYVVISTHSNEIYEACLEKLAAFNYHIMAEHDTFESYTYDGLIVACADKIQEPGVLEIHKRSAAEWTWEAAVRAWAGKEGYLEKHRQILHSSELRPMLEYTRDERDRLLNEQETLKGNVLQFQEEVLRLQQEMAREQENLAVRELDYGARARQMYSLSKQVEELQRQIQGIRGRKISRIMRRLGKPLV